MVFTDDKNKDVIEIYDLDKRMKKLNEDLNNLKKKKDIEQIKKFKSQMISDNLAEVTQIKYLYKLIRLSELLEKDFESCDKKDIENLFLKMSDSKFTIKSANSYKLIVKRFYQWLRGYRRRQYPPEVEWLEAKTHYKSTINPEDLITEEEYLRMADSTDHPRNKAFISLIFESGCRIGEILKLKIKNINFDNLGAFSMVNGKTGPRRVRFRNSTPYLRAWLQVHPDKNNLDAPLWVTINNTRDIQFSGRKLSRDGKPYKNNWSYIMKYPAARKILLKAAQKAGVNKRVNPHTFRHSRGSLLAARGLNHSVMNSIMGWTQGSKMAGVYIHLSGQDCDDALMEKVYGEEVQKKKLQQMQSKSITCHFCKELNPYNAVRCTRCSTLIGDPTKEELEEDHQIVQLAQFYSDVLKDDSDIEQKIIAKWMKKIEAGMKQKGIIQ